MQEKRQPGLVDTRSFPLQIQDVAKTLRVATARQDDAECVSAALSNYESEVESEDGAWAVVIPAPAEASMLSALLRALEDCLDENQIPSVTVTIDEQTYVMEGPPV